MHTPATETSAAQAQSNPRPWLQRLASEPLLHFLLLGAFIFAAYSMAHPARNADDRRIAVRSADTERLRALAVQQWGRAPDERQMQDLVQAFIREEVLVREAVATGMDQGDTIVRRRLAQKMEFLAHADVQSPSLAEQRAYLEQHGEQFRVDSGVDFEQRYFNTSARGAAALAHAQQARTALQHNRSVSSDPSMLGVQRKRQTRADLTRDFGASFASAVYQLPEGEWSQPIASALGLHLVRVTRANRPQLPAFEAVQARVQAQMVNVRVAQARDAAYARLLARYTVVQEGTQPSLAPVDGAAPSPAVHNLLAQALNTWPKP